jgi:iron complex transport system substrate-binding protein
MRAMHEPFERIVCLTEEPAELLYLLGEQQRIVGISAYTVRPPEARREKPIVSAFMNGSISKIKALAPDLVIGFSDIQAKYAAELIAEGMQVMIFNQRSIAEILRVIVATGRLVGAEDKARALVHGYEARIDAVRARAADRARPRVYFEEWPDPIITSIRWVSELIEIAGGDNIFRDRAEHPNAKERIVQAQDVTERAPDVVFASWCGKPFDRAKFLSRPGFEQLPAVRNARVHEIASSIILQPGPACLTDGLDAIERLLE